MSVIGEGRDMQKCSTVRLRDLVCMTKEEATRHEKDVLKRGKAPEDVYDKEPIARVGAKLAEASRYEQFR